MSDILPLGWKRDKPDPRDFVVKYSKRRGINVEDLDLRKTGLLPHIYFQHDTNSCTSMAIAASIEYMLKKEGKPEFFPSRLFIYWNERVLGNCTDKDEGAEIRDGFKSLTKFGACPEKDWPFAPNNMFKAPPQKAFDDAQKTLITQYTRLSSTAKDVTAALSQGKPVVFGCEMFSNFNTEDTIKTGYIAMPKGHHIGGHCMLIVGIQPGYIIVRNSWSEQWGDKGYGYMPIDYMENDNLCSDFWTIDVV